MDASVSPGFARKKYATPMTRNSAQYRASPRAPSPSTASDLPLGSNVTVHPKATAGTHNIALSTRPLYIDGRREIRRSPRITHVTIINSACVSCKQLDSDRDGVE